MVERKKLVLEKSAEKPIIRQVRRACKDIVRWTESFISLGDVISQVDPVHIGLPWAGIKAILVVSSRSIESHSHY